MPESAGPGIAAAGRHGLRLAIVLLGTQVSVAQLTALGWSVLALSLMAVVLTFVFTKWLGRVLGVDPATTELLAAGTAICGASAIAAVNAAATRAPSTDVTYALACISLFGALTMVIDPLLASALSLDDKAFGLWVGASIHEVGQVAGAAFQLGPAAGEVAVITKLSRVVMLAPVAIVLGWLTARRHPPGSGMMPPVPWFVVGFVAVVGISSVWPVAAEFKKLLFTVTLFLLSMALAGAGLKTSIHELKLRGLRPLLLGAASTLFIATLSLAMIKAEALKSEPWTAAAASAWVDQVIGRWRNTEGPVAAPPPDWLARSLP